VQVCADVTPNSSGSAAPNKHEEKETAEQLLQRWQGHCDGARVQIQLVEVSQTDLHASRATSSPSTLFRQETQVSLVSVDSMDREDDAVGFTVKMDAQFDLKVRHEFWDRQVLLVVHVTPKSSVVEGVDGAGRCGGFELGVRGSLGASLLRDEWASSELLSLTREEAQPTPVMTRRVEQHIVVTKPLQLETKIRELVGQRVGVLARAANTHSTLALAVRDLHLHLDQSLRTPGREASRFRVVSGDIVPFPVVLQPQERYNFLFVLEPVEQAVTDESLRGPEAGGDELATSIKKKKKDKLHVARGAAGTSSPEQHTLLSLSWQALTVSMEAITENRTIVWSLKTPSGPFATLWSDEKQSQTEVRALVKDVLVGLGGDGKPYADFNCVRLLPDSALQVTVAPLPSGLSIGNAVIVCATVANRSARSAFDLTLLLPWAKVDGKNAAPDAVGFEASHRLGYVRRGGV
jgi:hypothetical protein